jgi:hypothetical protein
MDGSNNVIDFVKEKERKEAIEWVTKQFAMADENIRFDLEFTKIDQYDYSKSYHEFLPDDDKEPA